MLLKQQKPKNVSKPKRDLSRDLDTLVDQRLKSNRTSRLIESRYSNVLNMNSNIDRYPMIEASLGKFRREELTRSSDVNKTYDSFVKLFAKRISGSKTKKPITLTVRAKISGVVRDGVSEHTFGPFNTKMPVGLSKRDKYKFALSELMKSGINLVSGQSISELGFNIIGLGNKQPVNTKMGSLKLESYLLNKQRPITKHGAKSCVVDCVWDQVRAKNGFKTYTYEKLRDEIYEFVPEDEMINTRELIDWAKKCHTNVSIHAFDARYRKFITHANNHTDVSLVYIVKDHHCFPITDEKLKLIASKANQGGCKDLLKYMSDMKWTRRHENVMLIKKIDEVCDIRKENYIVVIPDGVNMRDAINLCSTNANLYVEYLHWNNSGILDGFIDHNRNMYLLNEEYDIRKNICNKLFGVYKTYDFKWTNQSFTSIAVSLFSQQCGYIPESTYNIHARELLDEYYPRALQWCTTEDVPEDVVCIDISKCYPSILLNNCFDIPIYTIHDVIEPFYCKSDLRQCGEFYIDETVLYNYGNPIKIEAGFYSSNLVSYLVNELNMSTKQIKFKIVTKKALKSDTFHKYFKYLFDNFSEGEAKRLANSFIGHLGMKYDKSNQGFTCTSYDTACYCWTAAMAEGKNVTVENFNEIYLVREQSVERKFSDHTSINRFVVSEAILKCLQLIRTCYGKNSVLYGYNTDGIFISNPKKNFKNKKM